MLYIHQYFAEPTSSGGTRSYEFARRLVGEGHAVTMVTSTAFLPTHRTNGRKLARFSVDGINVIAVPSHYNNSYSAMRRLLAFAYFALRSTSASVRQQRPDVIFATSTPLTVAIPALAARVRFRRNLVFEVRDLWPEVPIELGKLRSPAVQSCAYWLARRVYRASQAVIALSPGMERGIHRIAPGTPTHMIPNAADLQLFQSDVPSRKAVLDSMGIGAWPDDCPIAVYCGTLGFANDAAWLVLLADRVRESGSELRFLIVGDGAERERIISEASIRNLLDDRLVVFRPVPKQEVPAVLSLAAVCLCVFADYPILETTSPNKFFDALAASRPVAINYGGWQADLLRRSGAGVVLDRDAGRAAQQLTTFLNGDLAQASRSARRLAEHEFDRDELYAKWRTAIMAAATLRRDPPA